MVRFVVTGLFVGGLVAACGTADVIGDPLLGTAPDASVSGNGATSALPVSACDAPTKLEVMDPSTLPSCCDDGAARCVPANKVPAFVRPALAECSGGYCIPDAFLRSGGQPPPTCTSLGGAAGVCLSVCVPQVAQYKTMLPQATCADAERCAPCTNPLTGKDSGACKLGDAPTGPPAECSADGGGGAGGGAGAGGDAGLPCPHVGPPVLDPSTLPSCSPDNAAHCLGEALVPKDMASKLATCAGGYCVPDTFITTGGRFVAPSCTSVAGAEGRCLHVAIPQVAAQRGTLPQATCAAHERCVPCYNPLDQADTGACKLSCDPGPGAGPKPLACPYVGPPLVDPTKLVACGGAAGGAHCMDPTMVPAGMASKLKACPAGGGLCVPDRFIETGGRYVPPTCKSIGNLEGRCLHASLPDVDAKKAFLPRATCAANELCAPCYDPQTGADTGACRLSCDKGPAGAAPSTACPHTGAPLLDAAWFPACGGVGGAHCMPAGLVSASLQPQLDACAYNGGAGFCVPDVFLESAGRAVPKTCSSVLGAEGRCLHVKLKQVASQASELPQATCASYERCTPCYNPIDGAATGACSQSCDRGPTQPPRTFGFCCGNRARCVPSSMVPASFQERLESCGGGSLCVPSEHLNKSYVPPRCTGFALLLGGTYGGVCLSDCLSYSFMEDLVIKQGSCGAGYSCAPCTRLGQPTGAPGCN